VVAPPSPRCGTRAGACLRSGTRSSAAGRPSWRCWATMWTARPSRRCDSGRGYEMRTCDVRSVGMERCARNCRLHIQTGLGRHTHVRHTRVRHTRVRHTRVRHTRVRHTRVRHTRVRHTRVMHTRVVPPFPRSLDSLDHSITCCTPPSLALNPLLRSLPHHALPPPPRSTTRWTWRRRRPLWTATACASWRTSRPPRVRAGRGGRECGEEEARGGGSGGRRRRTTPGEPQR
jgi:hypothetical protein